MHSLTTEEREKCIQEAASRAAVRLVELFEMPMQVKIVRVMKGKLRDILKQSKEWDEPIVGASFVLSGPHGHFLFYFRPDVGHRVVTQLCPASETQNTNDFDERGRSVVTEVGNIFAGSFMGTLGDRLKSKLSFGAPGFVQDLLGAAFDGLIGDLDIASELIKIEILIVFEGNEFQARTLLLIQK